MNYGYLERYMHVMFALFLEFLLITRKVYIELIGGQNIFENTAFFDKIVCLVQIPLVHKVHRHNCKIGQLEPRHFSSCKQVVLVGCIFPCSSFYCHNRRLENFLRRKSTFLNFILTYITLKIIG